MERDAFNLGAGGSSSATRGNTGQEHADPDAAPSLPPLFWVLAVLALVLYLVAMVVVLAKPSARNLVYAIMSLCQVGNLVFIAAESALELGLPAPFPRLDMTLRMAFDLVTAAAIVNAACLHPRRLPGSGWIALIAWVAAFALVLLGEAKQLGGEDEWRESAPQGVACQITIRALSARP